MSKQRVLPADIYDTLELSVLAFGGIGRSNWWDRGLVSPDDDEAIPCCLHGHAQASGIVPEGTYVAASLQAIEVDIYDNDLAVTRINDRKKVDRDERVSWSDFTRELNIVRGD